MGKDSYFNEFVFKPTCLTRSILEHTLLVQLKKSKHEYENKNFFKKLFLIIKFTKLYYFEYTSLYKFILENNKKNNFTSDIVNILEKIKEIFGKILLVNILIQYGFQKEHTVGLVINSIAEKMKNDFYKLSQGKISPNIFKKKYGHYSTNEYEVTSLKYAEYEDGELLNFAKQIFKKQKIIKSRAVSYNDYIEHNQQYLLPVYVFLREELKSLNLRYLLELKMVLMNRYGKKIPFNKDIKQIIRER